MTNEKSGTLISSISAIEKPIGKIFDGDYLFEIPPYQRPYSWQEEQATQLLEDISYFTFKEKSLSSLPPYFLGSTVIVKHPNSREAKVVDGQQRLTTLTILLACIRDCISDPKQRDSIQEYIFQEGSIIKGTQNDYRLKTRIRDQKFFNDLIQKEEGLKELKNIRPHNAKSDSQKRMITNARAYLNMFEKYTQEQLTQLAGYIIQKCFLVVVSTTEEEAAFRIFSVLNDRGMQLTTADILKSEIIEQIPKNEQEGYTEDWENCEEALGIDAFKDFFSHLRAIYAKKKAEESVLKEIRNYVKPTENPKYFIDKILQPFTEAFGIVLNKNFSSDRLAVKINNKLKWLNNISHNDWVPPTILFLSKHLNSPELVLKFLTQLERLTLGMEIMRTYLNERIKRYADLMTSIEKTENIFDDNSALYFTQNEVTKLKKRLLDSDFYGKRFVKVVLLKVDEKLSEGSASYDHPIISIEHVLPQNPAEGSQWLKAFSEPKRNELTNKIGNLVLLSKRKNSKAGNYEFKTKLEKYFKTDTISPFALTTQVLNYEQWTPDDIQERTLMMANHVLEILDLTLIEADALTV